MSRYIPFAGLVLLTLLVGCHSETPAPAVATPPPVSSTLPPEVQQHREAMIQGARAAARMRGQAMQHAQQHP